MNFTAVSLALSNQSSLADRNPSLRIPNLQLHFWVVATPNSTMRRGKTPVGDKTWPATFMVLTVLGQLGPPVLGMWVQPEAPEGGTGPLGRDWRTSSLLYRSPESILLAWYVWTCKESSKNAAKAMLRNLISCVEWNTKQR